jgi:hypothetical protein
VKPIKLSDHARAELSQRGGTEQEVRDAIRGSEWQPARLGRVECRKNFEFNSTWRENFYQTKQVRPIFVDEPSEIVVVTVYVYYF